MAKKQSRSAPPRPQLEVVGVYRLSVTPKLLEQQFDLLYGYAKATPQERQLKAHCKRQLESVVLIEVVVKNRDGSFQMEAFTQEQEGRSRDSWQAAWCEAFLTQNGEKLLDIQWPELPPDKDLRIVYLHYYRPDKPLLTSYGERNCPPVEALPTRLKKLVPFEPVD